jgi:hypothetical protein
MAGEIIIESLPAMAESKWDLRTSAPSWGSKRGTSMVFDPFPAYPHDLDVVCQTAVEVEEKVAPLWNVEVYVADREGVARSNGWSHLFEDQEFTDGDWVRKPNIGVIMLAGKRIPPHPAVTRYLVAHEYGHNVEWMINSVRGARYPNDETLAVEYAKMRGPEVHTDFGGGGVWHNAIAEVLACDFRVMVLGIEPEFWPHPGVSRPDSRGMRDRVTGWWDEALHDLAKAAEA